MKGQVQVYRNLHKTLEDGTKVYSVRNSKNKVVDHVTEIALSRPIFRVGPKGNQRVRDEKRKNVHAGIRGYMEHKDLEVWADLPDDQFSEITYNPYKYSSFVDIKDSSPRWFGSVAKLRHKQVLVA